VKQVRRTAVPVYFSLPFLCFTYVLIVASSFLLADRGFEGVFSATLFNTPRGILLLVAGPFAILSFLGLFLYAVISDSLHSGTAGRFSAKVFLVSASLLFAVALPQTVIVCRFVGTAVGSWYNEGVSDSLVAVEDVAGLYAEERARSMEKVAGRYFTGLAITAYREHPTDWMSDIRSIDPHAVACQVYREDRVGDVTSYVPVIEAGDSERFLSRELFVHVRNGLFNLEGENDSFRYGALVRYSNSSYICIYTADIPEGFTDRLERVRETRAQARIIDTLKPYLPLMGIWIFAMFLLPSIVMILIIAFRAAITLGEPLRAIAEGTARLAEGDSSWRIVPRSKDETAVIGRMVNSIASRISYSRGQGKRMTASSTPRTPSTPRTQSTPPTAPEGASPKSEGENADKKGPHRL
jgi:nitrogen fixation/metabolism regulation signal transduction histidine kinase